MDIRRYMKFMFGDHSRYLKITVPELLFYVSVVAAVVLLPLTVGVLLERPSYETLGLVFWNLTLPVLGFYNWYMNLRKRVRFVC